MDTNVPLCDSHVLYVQLCVRYLCSHITYSCNTGFDTHRGLRNLIEPVLRRLMENDLLKMISFDNFFDSIQAIVQKKVINSYGHRHCLT